MRIKSAVKEISIPCILNRASLGSAEFVFAILKIGPKKRKTAWPPRKDITILEQKLLGEEIKGELTVGVENETDDAIFVNLINGGIKETLEIKKSVAV